MLPTRIILPVALLSVLGVTEAVADCQIADAKLEEAILQNPNLRGPTHRQAVRDLRSLRDAALTRGPTDFMTIASDSWQTSGNSS